MSTIYRHDLCGSFLIIPAIMAALILAPLAALAQDEPVESADDTSEGGEDPSSESDASEGEEKSEGESPAPVAPQEAEPEAAAATSEVAPPPADVAEPAPAKLAPPVVGYKNGFFIASPDGAFKLAINGRVQTLFTYENTDGTPRANEAQFSIPRARLKLKGHAFDKRVAFALEIDLGKGSLSLKDGWVDFNIIDKKLMLKAGQFKRPFSRQQITSSGKLQFVDRAITDKHFKGGRDLGIMLHSHKKLPFEYAVGLFNGSGDKGQLEGDVSVDTVTGEGEIESGKFSNVPELMDPMVVTRFGWHTKGYNSYTESDYKSSDFGIGIGGGIILDFDSDEDNDGAIRAGIDYALAVKGLSSTGGVYIATGQDGEGFKDQSFDSVGFHIQAGYTIKARVEPAIRYARIMSAGDAGDRQEFLGGVNVFFFGHNLKWSTDFGVLMTEEQDGELLTDFQARSQVQLSF